MRANNQAFRTFVVMTMLVVGLLAAMPAAAQPGDNGGPGNSGAAKQCQQGGWQALIRDDGTGFADENQCVGYAAQGGILHDLAAPEPTSTPPPTIENPNCQLARDYNYQTHLPVLAELDLSGCDLRGADLPQADLKWANLSYTDLRFADLSGATLSGAMLGGSQLTYANLTYANLSLTYLGGAHLDSANLTGANLSEADVSGAIWINTTCPDGTNSVPNGGTCEGHLQAP